VVIVVGAARSCAPSQAARQTPGATLGASRTREKTRKERTPYAPPG
jgi:hypothetical protein